MRKTEAGASGAVVVFSLSLEGLASIFAGDVAAADLKKWESGSRVPTKPL
jgi:hypothetical protein